MKIIALQAENIKRIVSVEIHPTSNVVQITGKNGQGKTSVLDSIWWALAGAKEIQKNPIRIGSDTAFIKLDLGEMVVTRNFKFNKDGEVTTSLSVENKDGVKIASPQALLDKMIGDLSFDPLIFSRATPQEQFNTLKKFVPNINFDEIEKANKEDYEKRTELNRKAKDRRSAASQIEVDLFRGGETVDETKLVEEMAKASQHNADIQIRQNNRNQMKKDIDAKRAEAEKLLSEAASLEAKLNAAGQLPQLIDINELQSKITEARYINAQATLLKQKENYETLAKQLEKESAALTDAIERRNADKQSKIASAKLPIKELSFGDNEILLNGIAFNQASDAEQLKASIAIAMALNPELRIVRIRDGSLLDDESMVVLEKMATENNTQAWIERVDSTGKVGIVIENGKIKTTNEEGEDPL